MSVGDVSELSGRGVRSVLPWSSSHRRCLSRASRRSRQSLMERILWWLLDMSVGDVSELSGRGVRCVLPWSSSYRRCLSRA